MICEIDGWVPGGMQSVVLVLVQVLFGALIEVCGRIFANMTAGC